MMANSNPTPKTLHYCWFGGAPLSERAEATITRWRELMPEYEIVRWDESNFDVNECAWVREAYKAKKWAFVSDYMRMKVIYDHGGVYMDVGSELLKSIDPLVEASAFSACEWDSGGVNTGLVLSAPPHCPPVGESLEIFKRLIFQDTREFMYSHTGPLIFGSVLSRYGYTWGVDTLWECDCFKVYPSEYFCPKLGFGGYKTTRNTYATHVNSASWCPPGEKYRNGFINKWAPYFGDFIARKAARLLTLAKFPKDER